MNTLLDILDAMTIAVPVVFLCTLLLLGWLGINWLRERDEDYEARLRQEWKQYGFDAWLELWEAKEQEKER